MRVSARNALTLVIPGLLGPLPTQEADGGMPRLSALERLLGRGHRHAGGGERGYEHTLYRLFGYHAEVSGAVPVAPLRRLGEGLDTGPGEWWLCVDPVQLVADQVQVYLVAQEEIGLQPDESAALLAALNQFYDGDGWLFDAATEAHWYVRVPYPASLVAASPGEIMGQALRDHLPAGSDGIKWHSVMNEIQMLFYSHPVSERRRQQGQRTIDGVWPWGGGQLPSPQPRRWQSLFADEPFATGIARHSGSAVLPLPPCSDEVRVAGDTLMVFNTLHLPAQAGLVSRWRNALVEIEEQWFAPLLSRLRTGRIDTLYIIPCNGDVWEINRPMLRRWWRRCLPLMHWIEGTR